MSDSRGLSSFRGSTSASTYLSSPSYPAAAKLEQLEAPCRPQPTLTATAHECRMEWSMASDLKLKYERIDDLDELNRLLRENTDFDERRALRAIIRAVKEKQSSDTACGGSGKRDGHDGSLGSAPKRESAGAQIVEAPTHRRHAQAQPHPLAEADKQDPGGTAAAAAADDEEERLRRNLRETLDYDEKKRIRAAIRDIRKRKGTSLDQQPLLPPESPSELTVRGFNSSINISGSGGNYNGSSFASVAAASDIGRTLGRVQLFPRRHNVRPVSWAAPPSASVSDGMMLSTSPSEDLTAVVTRCASNDKAAGGPGVDNAVCTPSAAVSRCNRFEPQSSQQSQSSQRQQELRKSASEQICGIGWPKSETVAVPATGSIERIDQNHRLKPSAADRSSAASDGAAAAGASPPRAPVSPASQLMSDQAEVPVLAKTGTVDVSPNSCVAERMPADVIESQPMVDDAMRQKIKSSLVRLQSEKTNATGKLQAGALANFNRLNNGPGIGRVSSLRIVSTRKPPKIVLPLSNIKAIDGSSQLSFTVGLCDAGSSVTALWYKNGSLLRPCKEMQQQCDQRAARLVFDEVFPDDAGVYRCVVQNDFGQAETSAWLTVESNPLWKTPEFVLGLEDKAVKSGTNLVLRVQLRAVPNPVLLWYRDSELLDDSQLVRQSFDGTTGTLTLSCVGAGSAGLYRCLARNSVGEQQTSCHLSIAGPDDDSDDVQMLRISEDLESIEPHDGDVGVSLICTLSAKALAARVTWSKDGKVLINNEDIKQLFDGVKASLMFNEIFPDDSGMYTCEVKVGQLVLATTCGLKVLGQKIEAPAADSGMAVKPATSYVLATDSSVHGDGSTAASAEAPSPASSLVEALDISHDASPSDPTSTQSSSDLLAFPIKADTNNNNEFSSILDEAELQKVLDSSHDYETRKKIRARLRELREAKRAERDSDRRRLDEEKATEAKRKLAEAELDKKRILDKFAELAKTSSVGAKPSASDELARRSVALADNEKQHALQEFQDRAKDSIGARSSVQQEVLKFKVESADQAKEASLRSYQSVARSEADMKKSSSSSGSTGHASNQQPAASAASAAGPELARELAQPPTVAAVAPAAAKAGGSAAIDVSEAAVPGQPVQQRHVLTRAPAAAAMQQRQQQPLRPVSMSLNLDVQPTRAAAPAAAGISSPLSAPTASSSLAAKWSPAAATVSPSKASVHSPAESTPLMLAAVPQTPASRPASQRTSSPRPELQQQQQQSPCTPARAGGIVTPVQAPSPPVLQSACPLTVESPYEGARTPKKEAAESCPPDHHDSSVKTPLRVAFSTPSPTVSTAASPGSAKTPPAAGAKGAMAAFKQLDKTNNPSAQQTRPNYLSSPSATQSPTGASPRSGGGLQRSVSDIKEMLLNWCRHATKDYKISIDNYSTSWNNGMAFCALIHHFYPEAFDYNSLDPKNRRYNFTLAFDTAEKYADIAPLLDVEDMVRMEKPDWKCVFTYVQSFYRKLRNFEVNKHQYAEN